MRILLLLGLASVTSACLHRPKIQAPEDFKTPASFQTPGAKEGRKAPLGRWWKAFANPELEHLIALAFGENLDLAAARARLAAADARLRGASAGYYPNLSASLSAGYNEAPLSFGGSAPPPGFPSRIESSSIRLSASASYEIDLWGKVHHGRKAARYALDASREDLRAGYVTLAANLADLYYVAVQQRALIRLLERTIELRGSQVKLVRSRYKGGVARADELYQALQSLAGARAQRVSAIEGLQLARNSLALLVGRFPGAVDGGKLDQLPQELVTLSAGVPAQLLLERPDLRAAFLRLQSADQQVGAAFAAHFPTINLSANIGYDLEPVSGLVWGLLAGLTAPIFQGGRINAQYRERQAQLEESIVLFKKGLLGAVKEVEDALVKGRTIAQRIGHLETRVKAAEGALRLSTDQYGQGLTIYLSVLTAEQALLGAQTELITARRELVSARISLARALGGAWMDSELKQAQPVAKPARKGS